MSFLAKQGSCRTVLAAASCYIFLIAVHGERRWLVIDYHLPRHPRRHLFYPVLPALEPFALTYNAERLPRGSRGSQIRKQTFCRQGVVRSLPFLSLTLAAGLLADPQELVTKPRLPPMTRCKFQSTSRPGSKIEAVSSSRPCWRPRRAAIARAQGATATSSSMI